MITPAKPKPSPTAKAVKPRTMYVNGCHGTAKFVPLYSTRKQATYDGALVHGSAEPALPVRVFDLSLASVEALAQLAFEPVNKIMRRQSGPFTSGEFVYAVFEAIGLTAKGGRK